MKGTVATGDARTKELVAGSAFSRGPPSKKGRPLQAMLNPPLTRKYMDHRRASEELVCRGLLNLVFEQPDPEGRPMMAAQMGTSF